MTTIAGEDQAKERGVTGDEVVVHERPALPSALGSPLTVLAGLAGVGTANAANLLVRTAGGDMYPPERRARGIGLVLFGAVFGAILMTLTGAMVVDHFHHHDHNVFPIIGVHVVGMYALVIVVGDVIDRIGRTLSLSGGLLLMGASVSGLVWVESVPATAAALFGLGLGWNVSYVAATAELAERTQPWERGRLLGFNDLLSGAIGAGLTLLGGLVLTTVGVAALALGATALLVVPALWILRHGTATHRRAVAVPVGRTP